MQMAFVPTQSGSVQMVPMTAGQFAPAGILGNILSTVAPIVGSAVGGEAGRVIGTVGSAVGQLIPLQAAQQFQGAQQFAGGQVLQMLPQFQTVQPQSFIPPSIQLIPQTAQQVQLIPQTAQQVQLIPQSAQQVQFAPQGAVGNAIGALAPVVGQLVSVIGSSVGPLLPFQASQGIAQSLPAGTAVVFH